MGYMPELETLRESTYLRTEVTSQFYLALKHHGLNYGQAKKLALDLYYMEPSRSNLRFLLCYNDDIVIKPILDIANMHREFYPLTLKLIGQYKYNIATINDGLPLRYLEFEWVYDGKYFLLQNEIDKLIDMVRENPVLKHIYYVDREYKVNVPRVGSARSNILLQSEAFKYETAEMFSKIGDLYKADIQSMARMEIEIPSEGNVMRAIRKDEAWKALKVANKV
uniref:Unclassified n=1 Tax=Fusarium acuminatum CS5907 TaxID=1318461 RepID=W1IBN4_9HYPO|nr:unclassified [Fusarium acuminatum CS5907]CDX63576.1 unclassified [Fusarium acuminatum CS5907]